MSKVELNSKVLVQGREGCWKVWRDLGNGNMYDFDANALQIFIVMTEKFKSVLGVNCFHCRQGQTSSQTVQFPQDLKSHHVDFLTIVS